jgi:hypothetical protein
MTTSLPTAKNMVGFMTGIQLKNALSNAGYTYFKDFQDYATLYAILLILKSGVSWFRQK